MTASQPDKIFAQLKKLSDSQFEEVLLHYGMAPEYLPGDKASAVEKSIALVRYAKNRQDLPRLQRITTDILAGRRPGERRANLLLPYLCNRHAQKSVLDTVLKHYCRQYRPRFPPLLAVLHGDECEHADIYRHLRYFLSKQDKNFERVYQYPLQLERCRDRDELHALLRVRLESHEFTDFTAKIRNSRQALVLYGTVYAGDWFAAGERHWLHALAEFWQERRANVPWLLLICVHNGGDKRSWLDRLRRRQAISACLNPLEALDLTAFTTRFGCPGVVLPHLRGVSRDDATRWSEHHQSDILRHGIDIEWLRQHIRELYQQHARDDTLPMCVLGQYLKAALSKN